MPGSATDFFVGMTLPGTFDNMKTIQLTQGKVAIVDDKDFEALNAHKWLASKNGYRFYAQRKFMNGCKWKTIMMHRVIMNAPDGFEIDHINGDGLDNRRDNLRVATRAQNSVNAGSHRDSKLGIRGVSPERGKYRASIRIDGKNKHLGRFHNVGDAIAAYQSAAKEHHGEFAHVA